MQLTQELQYALNTLWFVMAGALVMWMAAGFAMLEAGLVRSKNTTEILTKNVALYAVACIMYLLVGYNLMYGESNGIFGFVFLVSAVFWLLFKLSVGIRVSVAEELEGVDLVECGISAYPEFVTSPMLTDADTAGGRRIGALPAGSPSGATT